MQIKSAYIYTAFLKKMMAAILVCASVTIANAGSFVKDETVYGGLYNSSIVTSASFEVANFRPSGVSDSRLQNVVWFSIDEEFKIKTGNFTATVSVDIEKYDNTNTLTGTETVTFTVNYDPNEGVSYDQTDLYEFTGANKLVITVNSPGIVITPATASLLDAFRLEAKVTATRNYFEFTCTDVPEILEYSLDEDARTLVASWASIPKADEYDLEWTFYDTLSSVLVNSGSGNAVAFNNTFINNSTRITTPHTTYPISLVYPAGRIYLRIRAVKYDINGYRTVTIWHSEATGFAPSYTKDIYRLPDSKWHEKGLNWQMSVVYAEEGKKSQSVSYFDGAFRNRQSVSKSDASNVIIASETLYDRQGRPAVQVMPAPVTEYNYGAPSMPGHPWVHHIQFSPGYAAAPGLTYYTPNNFDNETEDCTPRVNPASVMDTANSIAARYYSSNNPWREKLFHNNIPSADGYPFAVTEYMPDQTGRIKRQSGVGLDFQLGTAHETKYFYSRPDQEELDRLFGVEAGYADHYQKNMVMDPNGSNNQDFITPGELNYAPGQMSVSYIDAHGRVVATALAGDPPASVSGLSNYSEASTITKNLLNNIADGMALRSTHTLMVSSRGTPATFLYSGPEVELSTIECLPDTICFDCLYDLEITIVDECGNFVGGTPVMISNFRLSEFIEFHETPTERFAELFLNCTEDEGSDSLFNRIDIENLPLGQYQVTKTLKVSRQALDVYIDEYMSRINCIPNLDSLTYQFLGDTSCYETCEECRTRLGTFSQFKDAYFEGISEDPNAEEIAAAQKIYDEALLQCDELCDESSPTMCSIIYESMLVDVSPGGQYATFGTDMVGDEEVFTAEATDVTSIFYTSDLEYQDDDLVYYDAYGFPDTIFLAEEGGFKLPNELTVNQFIRYFKPSWAKTLVQLHPEYCQYLCCLKENSDHSLDSLLEQVGSMQEAIDLGLWPLDDLIHQDSFFINNPGLVTEMTEFFNAYTQTDSSECSSPISLYQVISSIIFCGGEFPCDLKGCSGDSIYFWQILSNQYLSFKNHLKAAKIRGGACSISEPTIKPCPPPVYCFGQPTCGGSPNPFENKVSRVPTIPKYNQAEAEHQIQILLDSVRQETAFHCDEMCAGTADGWIYTLSLTCETIRTATTGDIEDLREDFIDICINGCDLDNPFGSGSATFFSSIQAAIKGVFPSLTGDSCTSPGCRAEVLDFPGTTSNPQYLGPAISLVPQYEDCDYCMLIKERRECWEDNNGETPDTDEAFLAYVNSLSNVIITLEEIDTTNFCLAGGCKYLSSPVTIHPFFQCNTCKTYSQVNTVWTTAGGIYDCSPPPSAPEAWEKMIAGYVNFQLGLNLTYDEIEDFIQTYSSSSSEVKACTFLCPKARFENVPLVDQPCVTPDRWESSRLLAEESIALQREKIKQEFISQYLQKCLGTDYTNEEVFTYSGNQTEYHYTLYYYDQAGNLVKTVPPKGVNPITNPTILNQIKAHRKAGPSSFVSSDYPAHTHATRYFYNTLNQVVQEKMPDHGGNGTYIWYDRLGRAVLSQNAQQRVDNKFTYTVFDALGRSIETGVALPASVPSFASDLTKIWDLTTPGEYTTWLATVTNKEEVTQTYYDDKIPGFTPYAAQDNLRNRIASVTYEDVRDSDPLTFQSATHYSYDIQGNVKYLVQDIPELDPVNHRYTLIEYNYDLVSGKVNAVYYQKNQPDQFIHRYNYDADNRLQFVETSRDGLLWSRDANYEYYLHGPLARTELGQYRVQGNDYAYTLQGWLKGVNASALALGSDAAIVADFDTRDMGRDGKSGNTGDWARNKTVARDALAFTLSYFNYSLASGTIIRNDYRRIGDMSGDPQLNFEMNPVGSSFNDNAPSLFNGNIRSSIYSIAKINPEYHKDVIGQYRPEGFIYRYDQLHRLVRANAWGDGSFYDLLTDYEWTVTGLTVPNNLKEEFSFDPNGNIMTADRYNNASTPTLLDDLEYHYSAPTSDNRLSHLTDAVTTGYTQDLESQTAGNYDYDEIGNLTQQDSEGYGAGSITWTYDQKLKAMGSEIKFSYNPMRERIVKSKKKLSLERDTRTYYLRDAQGNIMSTYTMKIQNIFSEIPTVESFEVNDYHIYGSARVGTLEQSTLLYSGSIGWEAPTNPHDPATASHTPRQLGQKRYELTNHLGNVLVVITDRKRGRAPTLNTGDPVEWYEPDVLSSQQYYAFGMLMPSDADPYVTRQYSLNGYDYRFGFNGKEGDDEVKGDDNQQDYGMRIYDPRVGRFLSVDPIARKYPMLTPYQFASNMPIQAVDLDGLEALSNQTYRELMSQIIVLRATQNKINYVRIYHTYNGVETWTQLDDSGLIEQELQGVEGQVKAAVANPGYAKDMQIAAKLATGYGDNANGFGVITRQILLNSGQINESSNQQTIDNNQFNNGILHFTGQAFFTILRGAESAKFVADIHERGRPQFFQGEPAANANNEIFEDYEDTYRDLLNNEYGRKFGEQLRNKYGDQVEYKLSVGTTVNVLNDIQDYLGKSFNLTFKKFDTSNRQVQRFTDLINEDRSENPANKPKPIEKY